MCIAIIVLFSRITYLCRNDLQEEAALRLAEEIRLENDYGIIQNAATV
jgi:hypothetical protein